MNIDDLSAAYDPTKYKWTSRENWNTVAPEYHNEWAAAGRGPFQSTAKMVDAARIEKGNSVLDVGCGTGAVSMQAAKKLGQSGLLVGADFSRGALRIARQAVPTGNFVEMDAENLGFAAKFDRILSQYALMFFPDTQKVLASLNSLLKDSGILAVAVHGTAKGVPYFSTIMEPVLQRIPDIRPEGTPTVHRFGQPEVLKQALESAGFAEVKIDKFVFEYEAGAFEEYWSDYMATTANSIRPKIEAAGNALSEIKEQARQSARQYETKGRITFPWDVLVATARKSNL